MTRFKRKAVTTVDKTCVDTYAKTNPTFFKEVFRVKLWTAIEVYNETHKVPFHKATFADHLGVCIPTVYNYLNGKSGGNKTTMTRASDFFGINQDYFNPPDTVKEQQAYSHLLVERDSRVQKGFEDVYAFLPYTPIEVSTESSIDVSLEAMINYMK